MSPSDAPEAPTRSLHLLAELTGHDDRAWSVAWNPAKPILASCSADKTVRLWSYTLPSPSSSSSDPASEPTTNGDASASSNTAAWRFTPVATIETGHSKTVRALAWSPTGTALATASFDASVGVWERAGAGAGAGADADTDGATLGDDGERESAPNGGWECAGLLEGHETECKGVAYAASGNLLATCARDKTVWIWEAMPDGEFECAAVLMEHTQDVKAVAWHPREDILASASYDDTIQLYSDDGGADDWASIAALAGHASTVWSVAFAPAGAHLASASADCTLRLWARGAGGRWAAAGAVRAHERTAYSVAWAAPPRPDGGEDSEGTTAIGWLASTGADGRINVYAVSEPSGGPPVLALLARIEGAHGVHDVNALAWCPLAGGARVLASAGDDGCVRVWEVR